MRQIVIKNLQHSKFQPVTARYCDTFFCRLRGLTFHKQLPPDRGLLLVQGRESRVDASIHMLGVWMDLAVVWINSNREVVDTRLARAWHLAYLPKQPARFILEMAPERLEDFHFGDHLIFEELADET